MATLYNISYYWWRKSRDQIYTGKERQKEAGHADVFAAEVYKRELKGKDANSISK